MKNILLFLLFLTVYFRYPTVVWDGRNQIGASLEAGASAFLLDKDGDNCLVKADSIIAWVDCDNLTARKPKSLLP